MNTTRVPPASTGSTRIVPPWRSTIRLQYLAPAVEEAGATGIAFHGFRHACASMLFAGGKNPVQAQRWLGHHDPAFTLRTYVHLMEDGLGEPLDLEAELAVADEPTPVPVA